MSDRVCMVPARGGSRRIPRKNLVEIGGLPLVARAIHVALQTGLFEDVLLSTDDPEIAEAGKAHGAVVPYLRPAALASASASLVDVALDLLDHQQAHGRPYESLCLLMPTAPLRAVADVAGAWAEFERRKCGSLMSVTRYTTGSPFWALRMDPTGRLAQVFGEEHFVDTHDRAGIFCPSGVVRWVRVDVLRRERTFYASDLIGYEVPSLRAIEIDDPDDVHLARALWAYQAGCGDGPGR